MLYTIQNEALTAVIDSQGAQLLSIRDATGHEWLWRGDPTYWAEHALTLFPFVGRQFEDAYLFRGRRYAMGIHGFAGSRDFTAQRRSPACVSLLIRDTEATRRDYPFSFCFAVTFALEHSCLQVRYTVQNLGEQPMFFAVGGHPGFALPLADKLRFEDHLLAFEPDAAPREVVIVPRCMVTGETLPFPLQSGRLALDHSLFRLGARILKNAGTSVRLYAPGAPRSVTLSFPSMPYLGLWHTAGTDAPFVCIEPWSARPGRYGQVEELSARDDLTALPPGGVSENEWGMRFANGE